MGKRVEEILGFCSGRPGRLQARLGRLESRLDLAVQEPRLRKDMPAGVEFVGADGTSSLVLLEEEIAHLRPATGSQGLVISLDGGTELEYRF